MCHSRHQVYPILGEALLGWEHSQISHHWPAPFVRSTFNLGLRQEDIKIQKWMTVTHYKHSPLHKHHAPQNEKSHITRRQTVSFPISQTSHLPYILLPVSWRLSLGPLRNTPMPDEIYREFLAGAILAKENNGFIGELEVFHIPCGVEVNRMYTCIKTHRTVHQKKQI